MARSLADTPQSINQSGLCKARELGDIFVLTASVGRITVVR
jgi:hypothetical protein